MDNHWITVNALIADTRLRAARLSLHMHRPSCADSQVTRLMRKIRDAEAELACWHPSKLQDVSYRLAQIQKAEAAFQSLLCDAGFPPDLSEDTVDRHTGYPVDNRRKGPREIEG